MGRPECAIEVKKNFKKNFPQKTQFFENRKNALFLPKIDGFDCFKGLKWSLGTRADPWN